MPTIYPLFSAPVYVNNVGDFEKPSLKSLQFTSTMADGTPYNFLSSVDKNVLDRPDFKTVRDVVVRELDRYTRDLLAVNKRIEFYLDELVGQRSSTRALGWRSPAPQLIDLRRAVPEDERLERRHRLSSRRVEPLAVSAGARSRHRFVQSLQLQELGIRPKTNDICLFPSVVNHSVDPNQSDEERVSLAFNAYVRGEFGVLHKLNIISGIALERESCEQPNRVALVARPGRRR